ncbi:MAG TPA: nuclear transport factor 2 family protein [Vicinamibacterales bacterium]|nr:nuclear transport factor 2 family protein [Vicinamibacterales bacterium]
MCRNPAVLLAALATLQTPAPVDPQALQRMVATERAFAAATGEIGVRDGFLTFFAEDAVRIERAPKVAVGPARPALIAQTLQRLPIANKLMWEPFTGHISSDGTLGWLTGGFVSMNQAQHEVVGQGAYFSVWKRQPDGTWRVWLDEGIGLPQIWQGAAPFRVAPDPDTGTIGSATETIDAAEASIASNLDAWRGRLSADVRLHLDAHMPFVGRDAVIASTRANTAATYTLLRSEVAGSGDLAVTIGALDLRSTPAQHGSWVRVWKRDVTGRWRIVFQTEKTAG